MLDIAQLEKLVEKGASIGEIAQTALVPPPERMPRVLLARCALPRWFDRKLYETLLTEDVPDAPTWSDFRGSLKIEEFDTRRKRYCLQDEDRTEGLSYWKEQRSALTSFAKELSRFFANKHSLDRFAAVILADSDKGLNEFRDRYKQADARFDLAECETLLRILRNRYTLLEEPLKTALNDREQYLTSRSMFADDYWRTVAFIERDRLAEHFDEWRADTTRWVLHLHGKGGLGKTMFLRWLIARRCVVERSGERIPVARLDSDFVDKASLARWPWLALIPAAQQLNPQLPNSPFNNLLTSSGEFAAVLRKPAGHADDDSRYQLLKKLEPAAATYAESVPHGFVNALKDTPVVLVIDTIEDLMLHYRTGLNAMLDLLAQARGQCLGLHVILSGRYNLADRERLPKFMSRHCEPIDRLRVEGFSKKESFRYLHVLRGLKKDGRLRAIYEKTKGNPFALSLFADICLDNPKLTSREIAAYPKADFAYLIERIIRRIPANQHAIAWLLRYAAIPRQITPDFVRDVLARHLEREMTTGGQLDRQREFTQEESLRFYREAELWRKNRTVAIERLWRQLVAYASDNSWISVDEGVVNLQSEVRLPMRQFLRHNAIYLQLQGDAARYFERLASANSSRWGEFTAEALYHRFHLDGPKAGGRWQKSLNGKPARDLTTRLRIAEVPLSSDFVDDRNRQVLYDKLPLVARDTLIRAAFEKAYVTLVLRLRMRVTHPDVERLNETFIDACRQLDDLERNLPGSTSPIPKSRRQLIQGAQAVVNDCGLSAKDLLVRALRQERRKDFRIVLYFLLARTLAQTKPDVADRYLIAASALARRLKDSPISAQWIEFRRGRRLEERDEYSRALKAYEKALDLALTERPQCPYTAELYRRITSILRKLGFWAEAEAFGTQKRFANLKDDPAFVFEQAYTKTRVALDTYDPIHAMQAVPQGSGGEQLELRGMALSAGMFFQRAEDDLSAARSAYESSLYGPAYAVVRKAHLFLEELGNPWLARETLDSIRGRQLRQNREPFIEHSLLLARANLKLGNVGRCRTGLSALFAEVAIEGARSQLRVAAHELALVPTDDRRALHFLAKLDKIHPLEARYALLEPFRLSEGTTGKSGVLSKRFLSVIPAPTTKSPDFVMRTFFWGCAAMFFLDNVRASRTLLEGYRRADGRPHLRRQIRKALERANAPLPLVEPYLESYEEHFKEFSNLVATALIEEAERAQQYDSHYAAILTERARERLQIPTSTPSLWHVRLAGLQKGPEREKVLLEASQVAVRIGDRAEKTRIGHLLEDLRHHHQQIFSADALLAPHSVLRIIRSPAAGKDVLYIQLFTGSIPSQPRTISSEDNDLARKLWESATSNRALGLVDLMTNQGFPDALRALLGEAVEVTSYSPLALMVEKGGLSSVPWEIAFDVKRIDCIFRRNVEADNLRNTVLWVQSAISRRGRKLALDGILGRRTISSLMRFGGRSPYEARKKLWAVSRESGRPSGAAVLVVQRSLEEQRYLRRGHGVVGVDLTDLYKKQTVRVSAMRDPSPDGFIEALSSSTPSLVHVVCSFQESPRTGEIYLDLGAQARIEEVSTSQSSDVLLTAGFVDSMLRRGGENEIAPFVIVEAILPLDDYDLARQTLFRNAFCSELFRLGRTRGVLGIGFYDMSSLLACLEATVQAAAMGDSLGMLHRRLWSLPGHLVPPALFTADPDLPVLW